MPVRLDFKPISPLPPAYTGNGTDRPKGPLKRLLNSIKALFRGKRRSPGSQRYNRILEASLIYLDADLERIEADFVYHTALLEDHFAAFKLYHAEKRALEATLQYRKSHVDFDEACKNAHATGIEAMDVKIKHEAARKVAIEAKLEALKAEKHSAELAVYFVETDLQDRYAKGQCSKA